MLPRILIDRTPLPDGGDLRLYQRGAEFSITLGGNELMNSRLSGSEEALATLACQACSTLPRASVLIGGLGMGFTLRAALAVLRSDASIIVAELVPAVITWAQGPMASFHGNSLDDPRVEMVMADVAQLISESKAPLDAILLDVDNGPDGLTQSGNDRLYSAQGLRAAWHALRPSGVLAVWSSGPDSAFARRLGEAGFAVEEHQVHAHQGKRGARHIIWCAKRRT